MKAEYAPLNDDFGSAKISPSARLDVNKWLRFSRDYFTNKHLVLEERFDFSQCDVENANYKGISAKQILFCEGTISKTILSLAIYHYHPLKERS